MGRLTHNSRRLHIVLLLGGIVGGMVETGVIVVVSEGVGSPNALMSGYALRLAIVCPACIVEGSAIQVTDDLECAGGSVKDWSQPAVRPSASLD